LENLINVFASRINSGNQDGGREQRGTYVKLITTLAATAGVLAISLWVIRRSTEGNGSGVLDELEREIALDHGQRSQIERILADARCRYMQMKEHTDALLIETRNATRCHISALLTPAQRSLFEQWIRKREQSGTMAQTGSRHRSAIIEPRIRD
jgi:hypothetical protein